jgi:hypothetical protein
LCFERDNEIKVVMLEKNTKRIISANGSAFALLDILEKESVCSRSCYSVLIFLCSSTVNDPHCLYRFLLYTLTHVTH